MKTYKFSQKGFNQAQGYTDIDKYKVVKMGASIAVMITVGLVTATSTAIVMTAAYPITGTIGKLVLNGFVFKTLLSAI